MSKNFSKKSISIIYKCLRALVFAFWLTFLAVYFFGGYYSRNAYPIKHEKEITNISKQYELDTALVFSVIKVESNFNTSAVSKKGAIGLMQIKPDTAKYIADLKGVSEYDLLDAKTNIDFGCYYLRYLLNKFEVLETALCAYNAGEGNVNLWLVNEQYSKDGKTLEKIPFRETERYVNKTKRARVKYEKLLSNIVDK